MLDAVLEGHQLVAELTGNYVTHISSSSSSSATRGRVGGVFPPTGRQGGTLARGTAPRPLWTGGLVREEIVGREAGLAVLTRQAVWR